MNKVIKKSAGIYHVGKMLFPLQILVTKDVDLIADELEEDKEKVRKIFYTALELAPDYDVDKICNALRMGGGR